MRKNPASKVPSILHSVPSHDIFHTTAPARENRVSRIFVAIGCIIPRIILTGTNRMVVARSELRRISVIAWVIVVRIISLLRGRRKNKKPQILKRRDIFA